MSNQLDSETHIFVFDLMACYDAASKPRTKQSLLTAINTKLADYFDPEAEYEGSRLVPTPRRLVFTLLTQPPFVDDSDEDEFCGPDVVHTIDIKTGKYTTA